MIVGTPTMHKDMFLHKALLLVLYT